MTKEQLHILQHALGTDQYGRGTMHRNHYVGGDDKCRPLVAMGYMVEKKPHAITGGDVWFMVTDEGKRAMIAESPMPPKFTRSQKRYQDFLDASDAWNCTFREYLDIIKTDWYKELKANG